MKIKKKKVKKFLYHGCGFPVILEEAEFWNVRSEWLLKVNHDILFQEVLKKLIEMKGRLTGNQVKFVRTYFQLKLQVFAARFGVSHVAVMKWEKKGNFQTGMAWGIEKDIRLFIQSKLSKNPKDLYEVYALLETLVEDKSASISINAKKLAA